MSKKLRQFLEQHGYDPDNLSKPPRKTSREILLEIRARKAQELTREFLKRMGLD